MTVVLAAEYEASIVVKADAVTAMERWQDVAQIALWTNLMDVRQTFPTADGIDLKGGQIVTVFNIRGNKYRLITTIIYATFTVILLDLLSHAEYDREKWKKR